VAPEQDFSVTDAEALLELIYARPTGRVVIVGGQAINFWADRYAPDAPQLRVHRPFTSRDLDLFGSITNAYRVASEARATLEKPKRRAASPVLANINITTGGVTRSVQFLRSVRGVTNREINDNAVQFTIGHVNIHVADPITMLKAKLHNLVELNQRGRNDRKHVEILQLCVPVFLERELAAADETDAAGRQCLRSIQRILELSGTAIARQVGQFEWQGLIPIKRLKKARNRRLKNFREHQLEHWLKAISQ
jgi:hypothetical protein